MEFLLYVFTSLLLCGFSLVQGFNVELSGTSCTLDEVTGGSNPCESLYDAICDGKHCKCPVNTHEDKALKRCKKGAGAAAPKSGSGDPFDDLPFEYAPEPKKPGEKDPKKPPTSSTSGGSSSPSGGSSSPSGGGDRSDSFNIGVRGTSCSTSNNPCASLYDAICDGSRCRCPTGTHEDKALKRCLKGAPKGGSGSSSDDLPFDYFPDGKKPSTGVDGGNRPDQTTNKNRPVYPPPQRPQQPVPAGPGGDPHIGEKTGGGIGGGIGVVIILALLYFCCCNRTKGKELLNKLPFMKSDPGTTLSMQPEAQQKQYAGVSSTQPIQYPQYPQPQYSQPQYPQPQYPQPQYPQPQYPQPQYPQPQYPQPQYPQPQYPQQQQQNLKYPQPNNTQASAPGTQ